MKVSKNFIENMNTVDNILGDWRYIEEEGPYAYNAKLLANHIKDNYSKEDIKKMIKSGGLKNVIRKVSNDSKTLPSSLAPMDPKSVLMRNKAYWGAASINEVYQILNDWVDGKDIKFKVKDTVTKDDIKKWEEKDNKRKEAIHNTISKLRGKFKDSNPEPAYAESFSEEELDYYTNVITEAFNIYFENTDIGLDKIVSCIYDINTMLYESTAENILTHKIAEAKKNGDKKLAKQYKSELNSMIKNREFIASRIKSSKKIYDDTMSDSEDTIKNNRKSIDKVNNELGDINNKKGVFNTIKNAKRKKELEDKREHLINDTNKARNAQADAANRLASTIGKKNADYHAQGIKPHHSDYGYMKDNDINDEYTSDYHSKAADNDKEADNSRGIVSANMKSNRLKKQEIMGIDKKKEDLEDKIVKATGDAIKYDNLKKAHADEQNKSKKEGANVKHG